MAKKPTRAEPAKSTGRGYSETTPGSDIPYGTKFEDRPITGWSLNRGEHVNTGYTGANPTGMSPEPWVSGYAREVTPYNQANPAAMRAYTRNAPYMEAVISDPKVMLAEMQKLQEMMAENPNDPVSEYRLRILRQALGDVYGVQPRDSYEGQIPTYPTTPRGR